MSINRCFSVYSVNSRAENYLSIMKVIEIYRVSIIIIVEVSIHLHLASYGHFIIYLSH